MFLEVLSGSLFLAQDVEVGKAFNHTLEPLKTHVQNFDAHPKAVMLNTPQHVMIGAFEGMLDPAIWPAPTNQDKINVPTLALMAANPNWNADYEKYVRELVPGIEYQVWTGVSHFLMMDEPQKFNDTLLAFLKKNDLLKK